MSRFVGLGFINFVVLTWNCVYHGVAVSGRAPATAVHHDSFYFGLAFSRAFLISLSRSS
mgnify:CR=1 FL=1